eukprot:1534488-Pleurochrysis_carterae.AAC.2
MGKQPRQVTQLAAEHSGGGHTRNRRTFARTLGGGGPDAPVDFTTSRRNRAGETGIADHHAHGLRRGTCLTHARTCTHTHVPRGRAE